MNHAIRCRVDVVNHHGNQKQNYVARDNVKVSVVQGHLNEAVVAAW
jgi:hypothetical protein